MFDTIVDHVKDEIAFEGENGVNLAQLWDLVREAVNKELQKSNAKDVGKLNLDESYMKFIWPTLLVPDLEFYEDIDIPIDDTAANKAGGADDNNKSDELADKSDKHGDTSKDNLPEDVTMSDNANKTDDMNVDVADKPEEAVETAADEDIAESSKKNGQSSKAINTRTSRGSKRTAKKPPAEKPTRTKRAKTKPKKKIQFDDDDDSDEFVPDDDPSEDDDYDDYDVVPEDESDEEMQKEEEEEEDEKPAKSKKSQPSKAETLALKETIKKNLKRIHNIENMSFEDVKEQYGNRLCILATKQLQEKQLYYGVAPGRVISENQTLVLKAILKARASGISQASLTKVLETDPRSTGHYVKALEKINAIIRKPVTLRGIHTNLCIHKRFCGKEYKDELVADFASQGTKAPINVNASGVFFTNAKLKDSLVELLEGAKGHTMFVQDVLSALGFNHNEKRVRKWFYCNLETIRMKGVNIVKLAALKKKLGRNYRCLKLIKDDEPAEDTNIPADIEISEEDSNFNRFKGRLVLTSKMNIPKHNRLMRDVTYDQQIFSLIAELGTTGATSRDFRARITYLDHKSLWKVVDNMLNSQAKAAKKHQIARHIEFDGRLRQYRYFTLKAYNELLGKDAPADINAPTPQFEISPAKLIETDFRNHNVLKAVKSGRAKKADEDKPKKPRGRPKKRPLPEDEVKAEGSNASEPATKRSRADMNTTPKPAGPTVAATGSPAADGQESTNTEAPAAIENMKSDQPTEGLPGTASADNTGVIGHTKAGIKFVKHAAPKSTTNLYLERRTKAMLALLEDHPIMEVGARMRHDLAKRLDDMYPGSKQSHRICLKTLWSTGRKLESQGLAQTTVVRSFHLSGSKSDTRVIFRKDIDANGPEMELFKKQLQESKILARGYMRITKPEYVQADDVESLDARLSRMQALLDSAEGAAAEELRESIRTLQSNMEMASEIAAKYPGRSTGGNWLTIAMQFGFVYARLIRTKLLHQYLFGLVQQNVDGILADNTLPTTVIANEMSVTLYLQIIGFFQLTPVIHEFLRDPKSLDLKIKDIPEEVKEVFLTNKNSFRRRLRIVLDIATNLGLLEPVYNDEMKPNYETSVSSLPNAYKVMDHVSIKDYRQADAPVISTYELKSSSDVAIYWSELQYLCSHRDLRLESTPMHENFADDPFVCTLYTAKNWSVTTVYTREQRKVLNQYIDKKTYTTPLKNIYFCRTLADSLDMPLAMVTAYYRRMEEAFQRKADIQAAKKLARRIGGSTRRRQKRSGEEKESKAVKLSSKRAFARWDIGHSVESVVRRRTRKTAAGEANDDLPLIDEDNVYATLGPLKRAPRYTWKEEEDDLLIYAYVIMKYRGRFTRFSWQPIGQLIPGRKPEACRYRISLLRRNPERVQELDNLIKIWPSLYEEALKTGVFKDDLRSADFNLLDQLEYFIQRAQGIEQIKDYYRATELPCTIEGMTNYEIEYPINERNNERLEERFQNAPTSLQRNQVLSSTSFTIREDGSAKTDNLPDEKLPELQTENRINELLQVLYRMILLTPTELYDPFFAYSLFSRYSEEAQKYALETSHKRGVLVKPHYSIRHARRLPVSSYGLSRKYQHRMAGRFTKDFFAQALEHEKALVNQGQLQFNATLVTNGIMACLLDLLSTDKIQFDIMNQGLELTKHLIPMYRARMLDQSLTNFPIEMTMMENSTNEALMDIEPSSTEVKSLDEIAFEVEWSGFFHTKDAESRPVLHAIVKYLRKVQDRGASLPEIKDKVLESVPGASDVMIRNCLDMLMQRQVPLVHRVGFESLRYVLVTHLDNWVIDARTGVASATDIAAEVKRDPIAINKVCKQDVLDPRMWNSITGNVTTAVLASCEENIFQQVMQRPGITERALHRPMQDLLTFAELKELLENMTRRGILRSQAFASHKATMFSSLATISKLPPSGIDANAETHYWVCSGYYNKFA